MLVAFLTTAILAPLFALVVMSGYSHEIQWYISDVSGVVSSFFLALTVFSLVSYRQTLLKVLSLLAVMLELWWCVDYALTELFNNSLVRTINDLIFLTISLPLTGNILFRSYNTTDGYRPDGIFSVYRKPTNLFGLLAALITTPYGSRSIVKNGIEFVFKDGTLIGRTYKPRPTDHYVEIEDVNIEEQLGVKWSIFHNCFTCCGKLYGKKR